jgi:predicted transcriptional regulator
MTDILELDIRRKIFELIQQDPGLHARRIAELLGIQGQKADYHLAYLEDTNLILSTKEEGYRRYYVKNIGLGAEEKKILSLLRQEHPLEIVVYLLEHPLSHHRDILKKVSLSKSLLSYHLKKLLNHHIISIQFSGSDKYYSVANRDGIIALLVRYRPHSRIERFKDTWVDFTFPKKKPSEKKTDEGPSQSK